jgi:sn-glycerol 3-phosphate transport system ATP-binding protein
MSLGTKVILLEKGKIRQEATPEEMYASPANVFSAKFIGTPPMNILGADKAAVALPHGTRSFGFRPEKAGIAVDRAAAPAEAAVFPGELVTHEMLGSEVLYQVHGDGWKAQVKLYENRKIPYGPVFVHVGRKDIFCFDGEGNRITGSDPGAGTAP